MNLTRDAIERCRTAKGAFTKATVEALGLRWHELKAGWPDRLLGKEVSDEQYAKALAGRQKFKTDRPILVRLHPKIAELVMEEMERIAAMPVPKAQACLSPEPSTVDEVVNEYLWMALRHGDITHHYTAL